MSDQDKIIPALDNIVQLLHESATCLLKHVDSTRDKELIIKLKSIAKRRRNMIEEIEDALLDFGVHSDVKESLNNIKAILDNTELKITDKISQSENILITAYKNTLQFSVEEKLKSTLQRHIKMIEEDIKDCDLQSVA